MSSKSTVPQRRFVAITGEVNVGKSTLFNALTGQQNAIVSPISGTTTDPVQKHMELLPFGPITLIDTAGLSDGSALGGQRLEKTGDVLRRCDAAIYVMDAACPERDGYAAFCRRALPHVLALTKCDIADSASLAELKALYPAALDASDADAVRGALAALLAGLGQCARPMLYDLVAPGGTVLLVAPVDSEAPKGRLILPQMQAIRDCLDHGIFCAVIRPDGLDDALARLPGIDLAVTDSQAFAQVAAQLPPDVPLTSFSMLLARQKGDFERLLSGADAANRLKDGDTVLMLEGCTHNHTHEDIGRVKIPAMLRKRTGKRLAFDTRSGYDFPKELTGYAMAVQCGSCMLSQAELDNRGELLEESGVPLTNYGILLAWGAGILDRCVGAFKVTYD